MTVQQHTSRSPDQAQLEHSPGNRAGARASIGQRDLFEVDVDGAIHADPGALKAAGDWLLARYRETVEHRSGAGSPVLMGLIRAMAESRRIREVVGPVPVAEVTPAVPVRLVEASVAEAAALMGCTPRWVRVLAGSGKIRARRVGTVWLIDITNYLED